MRFTLEQLAHVLGREPSEAPGPTIAGVRPVEFAQSTDITYVSDVRYLDALFQGSACAVVAPSEFDVRGMPCIRSDNPEADFARLTALFWAYGSPPLGISPKSEVHPEANVAKGASIGAFAVIGRGTTVGDRAVIGPHVVIGEDVEVGEDSRLFPHVTVYDRVKIGKRVIIHSGTVIGSDGFGYARDVDSQGAPVAIKKYHSGSVEIEDDVEIGALCAIDRALAGVTRIGRGVKVDNLVQIAHNVQIGSGSVIASQVGIAGSSSMGKYCLVGGQVGVKDHVSVGNGVVLATRVGIYRNVPDGSVMAGSVPAMPHKIFLRAQSLFKRLPEIFERVRKLERLAEVNRKEEV